MSLVRASSADWDEGGAYEVCDGHRLWIVVLAGAGTLSSVDRKDLAGKLLSATDWVREEFAAIEEIAAGLGCEQRLEGGPGLVFHLAGQLVAKAHPKKPHIGIGFPNAVRTDVDDLTGRLRLPKDHAWFNHEPGAVDRETVELLFGISVENLAAGSTKRSRPSSQLSDRPVTRPVLDDDADLRLILTVLRAFQQHETTTGTASAAKPLRETIYFRWEGPRLPPGGKYSPLLPHSPNARKQRRSTGRTAGLVYEHVVPISGVIRSLLRDLPQDEAALRQVLDATAERVIVTKSEDDIVTAAGYRADVPEPDDPWSKYRVALGLQPSDFAAFSDPDSTAPSPDN